MHIPLSLGSLGSLSLSHTLSKGHSQGLMGSHGVSQGCTGATGSFYSCCQCIRPMLSRSYL